MNEFNDAEYHLVRQQIVRTLLEMMPSLKGFCMSDEGQLAADHIKDELKKIADNYELTDV